MPLKSAIVLVTIAVTALTLGIQPSTGSMASNRILLHSRYLPMAYSECPQVDALTQRLVDAYQRMSDSEIQAGSVVSDLHSAIMDHKASCIFCKKMMMKPAISILGSQRVA
jgi:hypothetical protein